MHEFAGLQACLAWIVSDIAAEIFELGLGSDQVIETVLLPEASRLTNSLVDLTTSKTLPFLALLQHRIIVRESDEHVDVIWHHNEISQPVPVSVEFLQAARDNPGVCRIFQYAGPMTLVEFVVPPVLEQRK